MNLTIRVIDCHIAVSDGCKLHSAGSDIVGDSKLREILRERDVGVNLTKEAAKVPGETDRFLLYMNMAIAPHFQGDTEVRLKCPVCGNVYVLEKSSMEKVLREYE
ncbi:MAG TPA: hypothetical protein VFE88_01650 [Candidatus Nanoarchaeia archaeon]|nr:hypothetical protein [Candidatus Nanoarchaeia archaeon]